MPQSIKAAVLYRGANAPVTYRVHFTPRSGNLEFLRCGEFEIQPGARTQPLAFPHEEALLYAWRGNAVAELDGASYEMSEYDVLYLPKGQTWSLSNPDTVPA